MTHQTTNQTNTAAGNTGNARPSHIVRNKTGHGKNAEFETLGMACDRGDGSLYIKPYGMQIIEGGFYVFPVAADQEGGR